MGWGPSGGPRGSANVRPAVFRIGTHRRIDRWLRGLARIVGWTRLWTVPFRRDVMGRADGGGGPHGMVPVRPAGVGLRVRADQSLHQGQELTHAVVDAPAFVR
jgi:hypothetical protein